MSTVEALLREHRYKICEVWGIGNVAYEEMNGDLEWDDDVEWSSFSSSFRGRDGA